MDQITNQQTNQKDMPGKMAIKVAGLLMMAFGLACFGLLVAGLAAVFTELMVSHIAFLMCVGGSSGVLLGVAGIVGVVNCGKMEKAITCFVWGIIAGLSGVTYVILNVLTSSDGAPFFEVPGLYIAPLGFPILYIVGASINLYTKFNRK